MASNGSIKTVATEPRPAPVPHDDSEKDEVTLTATENNVMPSVVTNALKTEYVYDRDSCFNILRTLDVTNSPFNEQPLDPVLEREVVWCRRDMRTSYMKSRNQFAYEDTNKYIHQLVRTVYARKPLPIPPLKPIGDNNNNGSGNFKNNGTDNAKVNPEAEKSVRAVDLAVNTTLNISELTNVNDLSSIQGEQVEISKTTITSVVGPPEEKITSTPKSRVNGITSDESNGNMVKQPDSSAEPSKADECKDGTLDLDALKKEKLEYIRQRDEAKKKEKAERKKILEEQKLRNKQVKEVIVTEGKPRVLTKSMAPIKAGGIIDGDSPVEILEHGFKWKSYDDYSNKHSKLVKRINAFAEANPTAVQVGGKMFPRHDAEEFEDAVQAALQVQKALFDGTLLTRLGVEQPNFDRKISTWLNHVWPETTPEDEFYQVKRVRLDKGVKLTPIISAPQETGVESVVQERPIDDSDVEDEEEDDSLDDEVFNDSDADPVTLQTYETFFAHIMDRI